MPFIFEILIVGILVGLMSSNLGIGGGIIMVPALSIYFNFNHQEAIATSLLTIVFVNLINIISFQLQKLINWRTVFLIATFSSITSFLAARTTTYISEVILIIIFIVFVFFMAYKTFVLVNITIKEESSSSKVLPSIGIGSVSGLISGFTGVGGGAVTTPMMLVTGIARNEQAAPISNGIMIFTASFAAFAFAIMPVENPTGWQIGYIHIDTALLLFASAIPSAYLGTKFQKYLSLKIRKNLLGFLLLLIGVRFTIKLISLF